MISHTRTILTPPTSHHHHTVLLHVMSLTRDICANDLSTAQPHLGRLALPGVRLLGLRDTDFETDAFHLGTADHCGGKRTALRLGGAATFADLVEGCGVDRRGVEGPSCWGFGSERGNVGSSRSKDNGAHEAESGVGGYEMHLCDDCARRMVIARLIAFQRC